MNTAVYRHKVTARVRPDGSLSAFYERDFDLMLARDTPDRMKKEAIRILRQIGYTPRDVVVHEREKESQP